jgi:hypothetical protein
LGRSPFGSPSASRDPKTDKPASRRPTFFIGRVR